MMPVRCADQPLAHAVQRLQVELIGSLGRDELHRRPLHRLGDRFRVAEVVLLPLAIGPHVFRRHQPGIVTERIELAGEMMCPNASLHADQARRHVGESRLDLTARPLLAQHNRAALIKANDVKRVLADIDTDHGDLGAWLSWAWALLLMLSPHSSVSCWQGRSTAGPSHYRTLAARHDVSAWANVFCKKGNIQALGYREDIAA